MAPEQADERPDDVDEQTDVYALGAVLYEILCGEPPFTGDDVWSIIAKVVNEKCPPPEDRLAVRSAPVRASEENRPAAERDSLDRLTAELRTVPPELSAVCMKALSKKKRARYATVEALAADVRTYLEGRTASAVPSKVREFGEKCVRAGIMTYKKLDEVLLEMESTEGARITLRALKSTLIDRGILTEETASSIEENIREKNLSKVRDRRRMANAATDASGRWVYGVIMALLLVLAALFRSCAQRTEREADDLQHKLYGYPR
ncbi:MAG: hypothetical protein HY719_06135 [Planctomycetes bacterium]|nr:hypothetical protein [Planctomycetota bacterium]